MKTGKQRWVVIAISLTTCIYLLAFAFNIAPYLRGPKTWRWAYAIPGAAHRQIIPALVLISYCVIATIWLIRLQADRHRSVVLFLAFTALSIPVIQGALLYPESPDILRPLFYRTISAGASGVFSVGTIIGNLGDFFKRYPSLMPSFPVHPQRYPPGLPALFYGARVIFESFQFLGNTLGMALRSYQCHDLALMRLSNATIASSVIQMALPVICSLIIVPLYDLAKKTIGHPAAFWVVALYPLVPSFAMWTARWDQFYPLLTCTVFAAFWRAFSDSEMSTAKYAIHLLFSGLLLSVTTFFSFGPIIILVPMGLTVLLWLLQNRQRRHWKRWFAGALIFMTGLIIPWVIYQIAFDNGFFEIWRVSMRYHLGLDRDYWIWLFFHIYDFLSFLGIPLALLIFIGIASAIHSGWKNDAAALPLGFCLALLFIDVLGISRGEVARVWLFLTPFAVIAAAYGLSRLKQKQWHNTLVMTLLACQLLVFNAFLRVVTTGIMDPPIITTTSLDTQKMLEMEVHFDNQIALVAYDVQPMVMQPDSKINVTLIWQGLIPVSRPYTVFVHLLGQDGSLITQHDGMPQHGKAVTSCWTPGTYIPDDHILQLPDDIKPGVYTLVAGLYDWETGERLSPVGSNTLPDQNVVLSTINIID